MGDRRRRGAEELKPLPRRFYDRPVVDVARDLLGRYLVRDSSAGRVVTRLVETEAYRGADDPGSHAFRGPTVRNAVMFGPPGHAYVYFTYGMHWCVNVTCQRAGEAAAVLLRAAAVVEGGDVVARRRPGVVPRDWARGPARLTKALALTGADNGVDLVGAELWVARGQPAAEDLVQTGPRVGVAGEGALTPWRFWIAGDPAVSPYRAAVRRRRSGR